MRPADVQTIDEMINENFTLHADNAVYGMMKNMDIYKRCPAHLFTNTFK
jgi:hypothetical protein